ncbi:hypothetical protein OIU77_001963 [Salix suchowensis]|uniref:Uncharacterized protein n=1 Tax=Salix suchowensis TaxID=1278906 RepID=A0ABQ9B384_9ROSI|nr:hypothetical protein OIU77_001963 [Salix suchowensis]
MLPSSSQAEKVVLSSEGSESVHNSVPLAPPLTDEGLQDPMVYEAAAAALGLGKDNSVSNGKSIEAVGNVSGGTGLTVLGSVAAGSIIGYGLCGADW